MNLPSPKGEGEPEILFPLLRERARVRANSLVHGYIDRAMTNYPHGQNCAESIYRTAMLLTARCSWARERL